MAIDRYAVEWLEAPGPAPTEHQFEAVRPAPPAHNHGNAGGQFALHDHPAVDGDPRFMPLIEHMNMGRRQVTMPHSHGHQPSPTDPYHLFLLLKDLKALLE